MMCKRQMDSWVNFVQPAAFAYNLFDKDKS